MIAIGSDHRGFELKEKIKEYYKNELLDFGAFNNERGIDEPFVALKVAKAVSEGECEKGILICGSGIGMSITANKVKNVRCGLCYNKEIAKSIKEHNNANIIAFGADYINFEETIEMIEIWKNSEFLEGIYEERLKIVENYETERK